MRYLLTITVDPAMWRSLPPEKRHEVLEAHDRFRTEVVEPGELLDWVALSDPSKTVRVRDDAAGVANGSSAETRWFLGRCYLVECDTLERATELACAIPDARSTAVEVRPLMHTAGLEM